MHYDYKNTQVDSFVQLSLLVIIHCVGSLIPPVDLCRSASSGSRTVKSLVIILLWSLVV